MIGVWCFFDYVGFVEFEFGGGLVVGLYLYIGLQIFIWMIQGEVLYCDSLGNVQVICFGQVNLMIVGYGIVYIEELLFDECYVYVVQLWIVLFYEQCDIVLVFDYYFDLLCWQEQGVIFILLVGVLVG